MPNWTFWIKRRVINLKNSLRDRWIKDVKVMWEQSIKETLSNYKDPSKFWRRVKKLLGNSGKIIDYILRDDGTKCFELEEEEEEEFRHKWEPIYKISEEENRHFCPSKEREVNDILRENGDLWRHYDDIDLSRLTLVNQLSHPITLEEFCRTVQDTARHKVPGRSNINKDTIINLPVNMVQNLKNILKLLFPPVFFQDCSNLPLLNSSLRQGKTLN